LTFFHQITPIDEHRVDHAIGCTADFHDDVGLDQTVQLLGAVGRARGQEQVRAEEKRTETSKQYHEIALLFQPPGKRQGGLQMFVHAEEVTPHADMQMFGAVLAPAEEEGTHP
jgi:hypothetical protein